MKTYRHTQEVLNEKAAAAASEAQLPTLAKLFQNGFKVMKVIHCDDRCAINVACGSTSGWLTSDGVFHRPVKGKKHVSVNTTTLERVW